jgi:DNA-binding CsgD family transcriptional regulator
MVASSELSGLVARIDEIYRPSLRGHWRRRVLNRLQTWTERPDLMLSWTEEDEAQDDRFVKVQLPDRDRAPRWMSFISALTPENQQVAMLLAPHVSRVAALMEGDLTRSDVPPRWQERLTKRQLEVAMLAANGGSNEDIANVLGIAPRTVARQLQETFRRLELSNRAALAAECALGRPPTPFMSPR